MKVEVTAEEHQKRLRVFKGTLRSAATVVTPVCHPAPRRFTLLAVRKTGATIETSGVGLRCFDYLSVVHPRMPLQC